MTYTLSAVKINKLLRISLIGKLQNILLLSFAYKIRVFYVSAVQMRILTVKEDLRPRKEKVYLVFLQIYYWFLIMPICLYLPYNIEPLSIILFLMISDSIGDSSESFWYSDHAVA